MQIFSNRFIKFYKFITYFDFDKLNIDLHCIDSVKHCIYIVYLNSSKYVLNMNNTCSVLSVQYSYMYMYGFFQ